MNLSGEDKQLLAELCRQNGVSQNEAVLYASENREAWRSTLGALEWLAAKVK